MNSSILHFISPPIPYFVDCGHASYDEGDHHINRNCIGVFDLIVVIKGMLPVAEDGRCWEVHEGEFLILRPDGHHYGAAPCLEETKIIWIHFQTYGSWNECLSMDDCLEGQAQLIENHKQKAFVNHADVCSIFLPKHRIIAPKAMEVLDLFFAQEHEPQSLRNWNRQASFQRFLQHLDRDLASPSDATAIQLAEQIELFIRHNYTRNITNSLLRDELNYHPNYLAKSMLKAYGMTPIAYLQTYRIEQAKRLLLQTSWSVARIAEEVGFHHVSHFSSCFSRKEGLSPTGFRSKFIRER